MLRTALCHSPDRAPAVAESALAAAGPRLLEGTEGAVERRPLKGAEDAVVEPLVTAVPVPVPPVLARVLPLDCFRMSQRATWLVARSQSAVPRLRQTWDSHAI